MGSLAKVSNQLLVDLLNSNNGTSFNYDELTLSPPNVNDVLNNNRNTSVVVTSSDQFSFQGSLTFYYNRIDFAALFQGLTITVGSAGVTDVSGLLPEINATYGLGLTMDDIVDQAVPTTGYPLALTLVAAPGSYAYYGQFQVIAQDIPPSISDNLSTTVLGNIGSDATNLYTNIADVQTLSASIIQMNLSRYVQSNYVRAVAQDVQQQGMVGIQQSLQISDIDDEVRSLRADLTTVQDTIGGYSTSITANTTLLATVDNRSQANASAISALQTLLSNDDTSLQAGITANSAAITALQVGKMSAPVFTSTTITTPSTNQATGVVNIAKLAVLLSVVTDVPCRIRLYPNVAERDNDLARNVSTPAPAGIGQLFEGITTSTLLTFFTGPTPFLYNGDTPADDTIAYTIEQGVTGVANVTLNYFILLE